jgi:hypothetical protein
VGTGAGGEGARDPSAEVETRRRLFLRKSALDRVSKEIQRYERYLDAPGREQLEGHLMAVREVESRLSMTLVPPGGGATQRCAAPAFAMQGIDFGSDANMAAVGKMQMDNVVAAFACGLTNVAVMQWSATNGNTVYRHLGFTEGHHPIAHSWPPGDNADKQRRIERWYAEQVAYLIARMKNVKEGDGTLLDNTIICWAHEHADGNHKGTGLQYVLAGKGGGKLRTGRYFKFNGQPHNDLLATIAHVMGMPPQRVGSFGTGPLPGLI